MEQISNQNMYSKIIEAMHCQHIMLPSVSPGAGNQFSTLCAVTEPGQCRNVTLDKGRRGMDDTKVLLLSVCSTQSLGRASKLQEANLKTLRKGWLIIT